MSEDVAAQSLKVSEENVDKLVVYVLSCLMQDVELDDLKDAFQHYPLQI